MNKLLRDLFMESDGDVNRENIAFSVAVVVFLVGQIRGTLGGGHWDPIGFGLTVSAIMIGGGAAIGSKQKTSSAIKRLKNRIDALEDLQKKSS